jgi:hypothetical protein
MVSFCTLKEVTDQFPSVLRGKGDSSVERSTALQHGFQMLAHLAFLWAEGCHPTNPNVIAQNQ